MIIYLDFLPRVYRLHERLVNLRSEYNLRLKSGVTTTQIPMVQIQTAQVLQQAPMRVRPELDEVTVRYIQDLLGWVEENQRRVDNGEWGSDLPSVESQLGSHRGLHHSVEEFRSKIERARADEVPIFLLLDFFLIWTFFKNAFFPLRIFSRVRSHLPAKLLTEIILGGWNCSTTNCW